ncbi:hypothetical protein A3K72_01735 [Candidatus Woesearchaeota archaeon RBG_13_36_6]|nr:MAG: hypothetical protein A3K72_01735 [Candidatus Woesearchaeota archaeon RBG_13_36_6]
MNSIPILRHLAELKGLEERLREEVEGVPHISVELLDTVLMLKLDLKKGFDGFERVDVFPRGGNVYLEYCGLYNLAFNTFLESGYYQDIEKSELLKTLRNRVWEIKKEYESGVAKQGSTFVTERVETKGDYDKIEQALDFFCEIFKEKAINQI